MTESEEQALAEAKAILALHFDAWVITTRASSDAETDRINSDWCGSLSDVLGMNRITGIRLDRLVLDKTQL